MIKSIRKSRWLYGALCWFAYGCAHQDPAADLPLISSDIAFKPGHPAAPELLPLQPIQPLHPDPAGRQAGWCVVQVDIGASGATTRQRIALCEPAGLFEEAALAAARKLRYSQAAAGTRDVQYRFQFEGDVAPRPEP